MKYSFVVLVFFIFCGLVFAQEAPSLTVDEFSICTAIEERVPVGADSSFSSDIGQLYCFTKIVGAEDTTSVSHISYNHQ